MSDVASPTFLVDASCDPVIIRIEGRASFQNSATLRDFMGEMRRQGRLRFVMDFQNCTSMDSTFLGVLAGSALELRKAGSDGSLVLCRVGERNLELIKNLGLHRLLVVDCPDASTQLRSGGTALAPQAKMNELENARLVLAAHENLVAADEANRTKFQDVLAFLKGRVDQG
ncbi:MAG: STAS domain-containing protein [Verrucomicrobia bacterium]|nr:STAS domain-containing protein [Verrucomicrobiota bacterium]